MIGLLRDMAWRKLLNLIQQLPKHSLTTARRGNDDELVFPYLDSLGEVEKKKMSAPSRPPLAGYTRETEKLDEVIASIWALTLRVDSALGGKTKPPKILTPETSRERWERVKRKTRMDALFAEVAESQRRWRERENK